MSIFLGSYAAVIFGPRTKPRPFFKAEIVSFPDLLSFLTWDVWLSRYKAAKYRTLKKGFWSSRRVILKLKEGDEYFTAQNTMDINFYTRA